MSYKRLSSGRFAFWPDGATPTRALEACELQVLLMGGDPTRAKAALSVAPAEPGGVERGSAWARTRLAQVGLLKREKRGNQLLYSAERKCTMYEELASILRKTSGVAEVLAGALDPAGDRIRVAFIFGSMGRGEERGGSDIDLIVIGDVGFAEVVKLLHTAQGVLGREINPKVYALKEWTAKRATPNGFLRDVLAKPKIIVIGTEDELAKPRRAQPRSGRA